MNKGVLAALLFTLLNYSPVACKAQLTELGALNYAEGLLQQYPTHVLGRNASRKGTTRWLEQVIKDDYKLQPKKIKDEWYVKDLVENYIISAILDYAARTGYKFEQKALLNSIQKIRMEGGLKQLTKENVDEMIGRIRKD